jgi:gas vesicle protein
MKKGWSWVKSKFNQHKGKIYEVAKKHGTAAAKHVGSRVLEVGKKAGKQVMDRAVQVAERNVEHYVGKAEKKIQGLADKAEFHISQYDRPPKKGSGIGSQYGRQYYPTVRMGGTPATGVNRRRTIGQFSAKDLLPYAKKGKGVFSAKFKRRARAGVQAFRRQR